MTKTALAWTLLASATCSSASTPTPPADAAATTDAVVDAPATKTPLGPPAPSLDAATAWLGTDAPISIADLRGQVVVIDFWT